MTKTIAGLSLRTKLFIAFAAMAVFPLLLLNFMTFRTTEQALLKTVFERNRSFAANIAEDIDFMFEEKIRMMKVAVNNTDIQSMNAARLVPALSPLAAHHHELLMAIVLAPNGDLLARSDGKTVTANYNDREYFRTAISTGKTTISDVLRSKTTGKLDIGIAEPIKNPDQTLRGMLVVGVSLHKIIERIAMTKIGTTGYAYVVNKKGKVLMHPDQSLVDKSADFSGMAPVKAAVNGQSGSLEYEFNGQRMLASYDYVPSTGWGLIVQQPLDEAMVASTSLRNTNIMIMAATILAAVAIVFVLAGFIFKPLAQLTKAVGKVTEGDLTAQISFTSSDEIGKLAAAFNNLTSQLSREETARHTAERASRATSEIFSLFMRYSPVYVFIKEVDSEGSRVLQASENFQDMVGIRGSDMIGKLMTELFPAEFAEKITAVDREVIAKGNVLKIDEELNGRSYATIKFPLVQGDSTLLAGYTIDITERKLAEEALLALKDTLQEQNEELQVNEESLRDQNDELLATEEMLRIQIEEYESAQKLLKESKARFDQVAELSNTVIWEMDARGLVTYISPVCEAVFGFRPDEAIGQIHFYDRFPESEREAMKKAVFGLFERKEPFKNLENNVLTKDGRLVWVSTNGIPLLNVEGNLLGYRGSDTDITELKHAEAARLNLEKQLLHAQKLESLGVLAGGIAHDFNNILTGIMGNISFALMFLDPTHKSYKRLTEAEKASVRAGELAQQLLTFARGGEPVKKVISVEQLIHESVSLVLSGSNVKGVFDINDSLQAIEADEGQLSQVFHNIIINAAQAMPGGGTVTVTARNKKLAIKNTLALPVGKYVRISFADNGCGISTDNLKKIFDPYFTTKSAGNGLGLASAHSIINKHGGSINATSTVGKGTTFTIYLPSTGVFGMGDQADSPTIDAGVHQGGSILVMDDEEIIRELTSEMLEYMGYQVKTCVEGMEAVALYKAAWESGNPFAAVIMDLTIPAGMGGKEAAQQILAIDPTACLIVSSGYSNDPIMADFTTYGFRTAVAKPYSIAEFSRLLGSLGWMR